MSIQGYAKIITDNLRTFGAAKDDDNLCLNAANELDKLRSENERLRTALKRIDYYYGINDCDEMSPADDAIEIDVKALREIHQLLKSE